MEAFKKLWKYKSELTLLGTAVTGAVYLYQKHLAEKKLQETFRQNTNVETPLTDVSILNEATFNAANEKAEFCIKDELKACAKIIDEFLLSRMPEKPQVRNSEVLQKYFIDNLTHLFSSFATLVTYAQIRSLFIRCSFLHLVKFMQNDIYNPELSQQAQFLVSLQFKNLYEQLFDNFHEYFTERANQLPKISLLKPNGELVSKESNLFMVHLTNFFFNDFDYPINGNGFLVDLLKIQVNELSFKRALAVQVNEQLSELIRSIGDDFANSNVFTSFAAANRLMERKSGELSSEKILLSALNYNSLPLQQLMNHCQSI